MASSGQSVVYARPPVRRAEFTLFFSAIRFDFALVSRLQAKWADSYPVPGQRTPRPRPSAIAASDYKETLWRLPAIELAGSSFNSILSYQHDQISLAWTFESGVAEDNGYPGYGGLADELCQRYSELVQVVGGRGGDIPRVEGALCYYTNALPTDFSSPDWIVGFLSNWESSGHRTRADISAEYLSLKVHRQDENHQLGTRRSVWIELDEGDEQPGEIDISSLSIPGEHFSGGGPESTKTARLLLDDSHQYEIDAFESSFSRETKEKWGTV